MLPACSHGRNLLSISLTSRSIAAATFGALSQQRRISTTPQRWVVARSVDKSQLQASYPLAEQLEATGIWRSRKPPVTAAKLGDHEANDENESEFKPESKPEKKTRSRGKKIKGDKSRVNIVSEKLVDDILSYIGPSLKRHEGCDLIDIYPGAGMWSRKLREVLKPRSHILMEPDEQLYRPFLEPILSEPGSVLVPKSGIVWRDLNTVLTPEYLPHQTPIENPFGPSPRNDTLLVTANIAFHPKKKYRSFESIALLVYHQLLDSIRTSTLFQQYGQVRMLIWSRQDDKGGLLPRLVQRRRRTAHDSELACEWVREVCGRDGPDSVWFVRDTATEIYSTLNVRQKMREAGMRVPRGRESTALREARRARGAHILDGPGKHPPMFKRPFGDTLEALETRHTKEILDKDSAEFKSMKSYQWRQNADERRYGQIHDVLQQLEHIAELEKTGQADAAELERLGQAWDEDICGRQKAFLQDFMTYKDNLHYIRQDPPVLHWDRREYEPLVMQPEEFYPNVECALMDLQPRDVHPLLRQTGQNSNRAGDMFQLVMGTLLMHGTTPLHKLLDVVWPGATDYIMPRWKSIKDLHHAGVPSVKSKYAEMTPRMLNAQQWEELLELWMEWPFRPELHELIGRTQDTDDPSAPSEENLPGSTGVMPGLGG